MENEEWKEFVYVKGRLFLMLFCIWKLKGKVKIKNYVYLKVSLFTMILVLNYV